MRQGIDTRRFFFIAGHSLACAIATFLIISPQSMAQIPKGPFLEVEGGFRGDLSEHATTDWILAYITAGYAFHNQTFIEISLGKTNQESFDNEIENGNMVTYYHHSIENLDLKIGIFFRPSWSSELYFGGGFANLKRTWDTQSESRTQDGNLVSSGTGSRTGHYLSVFAAVGFDHALSNSIYLDTELTYLTGSTSVHGAPEQRLKYLEATIGFRIHFPKN